MDINKALGRAIRIHRERAGKKQKYFSFDQGNLSKIENGKQNATFTSLERIADEIGVQPSAILATAEQLKNHRYEQAEEHFDPRTATVLNLAEQSHDQARLHASISNSVFWILETTPSAMPELHSLLAKLVKESPDRDDRKVLKHLAGQVAAHSVRKRPKSSSSAPRATGR